MKIRKVKLVDFLSDKERAEIESMVDIEVTIIINGEIIHTEDSLLGRLYAFAYLMDKVLN
jgi:hypothetical protein